MARVPKAEALEIIHLPVRELQVRAASLRRELPLLVGRTSSRTPREVAEPRC